MVLQTAKYLLFSVVSLACVIGLSQYQNCAPATDQTSAFNLGASGTPLTITLITLPSNAFQPGAPLTATAEVSNPANMSDPINCTWSVLDASNNQIESFGTQTAQSTNCILSSGFVPNAPGNYILALTATDTVTNQSAMNSMSFISGTGCIPNGQFCGSSNTPDYSCGDAPPSAPASCSGSVCCSGNGGIFSSVQQSGTYCTFNYACSY